jgi:peptidoglycan/xylan/chitin deacetylase (PgdA/CDA1 family)
MKRMLQRWSARTVGRAISAWPGSRIAILCYHSVHPENSFSTRPEAFEDHLRWLSEHCDVIPFNQVFAGDYGNRDRPAVAITFDDGYADNHEVAMPLLVKYGLTATFFLTAGFLQARQSVVHRFADGWQVPSSEIVPMTCSQMQELLAAGMQVGAHGYSHRPLGVLDETSTMTELTGSKNFLEDALGISIVNMSYPYGRPGSAVARETVRLAEEAGYQRAALVLFRRVQPADSLLELPRFVVDEDNVDVVREKILGRWDAIGICREQWVRLFP